MRISDWNSDVCSSDLDLAQRLPELVASIAAIGEDMAQPREAMDDFRQYEWCAVAVLDVGGVDYGMNEIDVGFGEDVALASLGFQLGRESCRERVCRYV